MFYLFPVQWSTLIQIQSCPLLLVAAQGKRASLHLTGAYFCGRASMRSILKNHTRAYFQVRPYFRRNRVGSNNWFMSLQSTSNQLICFQVLPIWDTFFLLSQWLAIHVKFPISCCLSRPFALYSSLQYFGYQDSQEILAQNAPMCLWMKVLCTSGGRGLM